MGFLQTLARVALESCRRCVVATALGRRVLCPILDSGLETARRYKSCEKRYQNEVGLL